MEEQTELFEEITSMIRDHEARMNEICEKLMKTPVDPRGINSTIDFHIKVIERITELAKGLDAKEYKIIGIIGQKTFLDIQAKLNIALGASYSLWKEKHPGILSLFAKSPKTLNLNLPNFPSLK